MSATVATLADPSEIDASNDFIAGMNRNGDGIPAVVYLASRKVIVPAKIRIASAVPTRSYTSKHGREMAAKRCDEVKATLAEIHSDRSNTIIVHSDVSHGALLFANQLRFCSIAIHSVGARPVHTIIWVDGTEFRWTRGQTAAAA